MEYRDLKEAYRADKQIYWHDNMVDYINWLEDKIIDSQTNWISVEDRLPTEKDADENGKVLVWREMNEGQAGLTKSILDWNMVKYCDKGSFWQPLPTPPKH